VIVADCCTPRLMLVRGRKQALERDRQMSTYRKALDWEGQVRMAIDPEKDPVVQEGEEPP
jgi:thiamine biosynthesis protein ThiC